MIKNLKKFYKFAELKTIEDLTNIRMCQKEIDIKNKEILQTMLFCVSFVLGGWLLMSYITDFYIFAQAIELRTPYSIVAVFSFLTFLYVRFFQKKYVTELTYIVNTSGVIYAFYVSSFAEYNVVSVTFLFMLFAISTLYIDYGWRIHTFMLICTCFYVFAISFFKTQEAFQVEAMNSYIILLLLFLIGTIVRQGRLDMYVAQHELKQIAYVDQLTGVASRRKLFENLGVMTQKDLGESVVALAMLDVDYFKKYNDKYGHQLGDACLRKLGKCLIQLSHNYPLQAYRYGGEEFVIVFKQCKEYGVTRAIESLVILVDELDIVHESSSHNKVTLSIGVAVVANTPEVNLDSLISKADQALYEAKSEGRNKVNYVQYNNKEELDAPQSLRQRREAKID